MPRKVYTRLYMAWTQATIDSIIATPKAVEKTENNLLIIRSAKSDGKVTWFAYVDRKRTKIGDARVVTLKEAKRIKDDFLFNSRQGAQIGVASFFLCAFKRWDARIWPQH